MKLKIVSILLTSLILVSQSILASDETEASMEGKSVYTAVNIWYERPPKILATNYHRGAMLPIGSPVTIESVDKKRIVFTDKNGGTFKIVINLRHTNTPGPEFVKKLFIEQNVMKKGGKFFKLTKLEQKNVKSGTIAKGMSKEAVLMAYGYPPTSKTHSIEQDNWTFWKSRFDTLLVTFEKDKIINILD